MKQTRQFVPSSRIRWVRQAAKCRIVLVERQDELGLISERRFQNHPSANRGPRKVFNGRVLSAVALRESSFSSRPSPLRDSVLSRAGRCHFIVHSRLAGMLKLLSRRWLKTPSPSSFHDHPVNDACLKLWIHRCHLNQTQALGLFAQHMHFACVRHSTRRKGDTTEKSSFGCNEVMSSTTRQSNLTHRQTGCRSAALVFSVLAVSKGHLVSCSADRVRHGDVR